MVLDMSTPTRNLPAGLRGKRFQKAWRRALGAGMLAALLASCSPSDGDRLATSLYRFAGSDRAPSLEVLEQTVEYSVIPASRAMVHAGDALIVLERNMGPALEQRIILPNATALRGDNLIHIRAQTGVSTRLWEFNFNELKTRFGGLPAPFQNLNEGTLMGGEDSLGSYVYAREAIGPSTVCVLVLRRLTITARPMPRGAEAMDVMMRNCVVGTLEQAMAPFGAPSLGVRGTGQQTVYTLSPHAAPRR